MSRSPFYNLHADVGADTVWRFKIFDGFDADGNETFIKTDNFDAEMHIAEAYNDIDKQAQIITLSTSNEGIAKDKDGYTFVATLTAAQSADLVYSADELKRDMRKPGARRVYDIEVTENLDGGNKKTTRILQGDFVIYAATKPIKE